MKRANTMIIGSVRLLAMLFLAATALVGGPHPASAIESQTFTFMQAKQLEYQFGNGKESFNWDAQAWVGQDYDKLWLKTQGDDFVKNAELQVLYSRAVSAFWDIQAGTRYDVKPEPSRTFGVLGIQGIAPYFFDIDAAAFVSDQGELSARLKAEYELLLTQRLIAEPSVELNFGVQDVEERGIGSGLSYYDLGLRVRYEIFRELAPYVGMVLERKVGRMADFSRGRGDDVEELTFVAGLRFWY